MYESLKSEIKSIVELVDTLPEKYRDRTFELLISHLLSDKPSAKQDDGHSTAKESQRKNGEKATDLTVSAKVRAFMRRHSLTEEQLSEVVMMDEGEVHFVREPKGEKNATAQIQWALLLALKTALLGGDLVVDPEAVRSVCIDKGFYDKANFATNFKTASNKAFFQKLLSPQGEPARLSQQGERQLAQILKDLATKDAA